MGIVRRAGKATQGMHSLDRTCPAVSAGPALPLVAASLVLLCSACTGGGGGGARATVGDSAGIHVVTSRTLDVPEWRLDSVPQLDLGSMDAVGPLQFYQVTGVRRMPDGRIVVANAGSSELRIFGADGSFMRSEGREGDGPGEFRALLGVWVVAGDSLFTWDRSQRRISVFTGQGDFVRSFSPRIKLLNAGVLEAYPDGRVMTSDLYLDFGKTGPGKDAKPIYMREALVDHDGALVDTLPLQLSTRMVLLGDAEHRMVGAPLFAARTQMAADAGGYWVGPAKTEEVLRYSPRGILKEILRWPGVDRTVVKEDQDRWLADQLKSQTADQAAFTREINASRPVAEAFPAYDALVARDNGELWVKEFERPGHAGGSRWMVFDSTGVLTAKVTTPASFTLRQAGTDYLLGVFRDDVDVEHIRMYGLSRRE